MRITVIGGAERSETQLRAVAASCGHELEFHPGHLSGPLSARLRGVVERADLVVIVTGINSHGAVIKARNVAREAGRPLCFVHKFGGAQLRKIAN